MSTVREKLATHLIRFAVYKIMPKQHRPNVERMFTLGAKAVREELRKERDRVFWERTGWEKPLEGHTMSIDYDRLRDEIYRLDNGDEQDSYEVDEWLYLNKSKIARELLRLRDEIAATRDRVADELERTPVELRSARITLYTEREHFHDFCNDLLEEGNE